MARTRNLAAERARFGDPVKAVLSYRVSATEVDAAGALRASLSLYDMGERGETEEDGWSVTEKCEAAHEHTRECLDALFARAKPALDALRAAAVAARSEQPPAPAPALVPAGYELARHGPQRGKP